MSGLNDLLANTEKSEVTLPTWYTTAQQDVANNAKNAMNSAPAFSDTLAAGTISDMKGPNSAFNQGQSALNTIASGAANPWMQDASGNTVGDPNTAMGGLFNAQSNYLNQILPNIAAAPTAGGVGSGQFGSLRGMTAAQKARGDAFGDLAQKQMTAALQNQATGVTAGTGLSNLGLNEAEAATKLTDVESKYPFAGALNYGNIINAMKVPETKEVQTQLSPLNMVGSILTAVNGTAGSGNTPGTAGLIKGVNDLYKGFTNIFDGGITFNQDGTYTTSNGDIIDPNEYSTGV
jgi:hypothetical protein